MFDMFKVKGQNWFSSEAQVDLDVFITAAQHLPAVGWS